jgi:ligand-binding SRPBCC domain-containing protein
MRELHFVQKLPITLDQAWDFFSDPANLKQITPEYMGFVVTSQEQRDMYTGQIIRYVVKPVLGIPLNWCTEITHVEEKKYFIDEQRFGPYAFWHHQHWFKEIEGGVLMEDILHYKVPLGPIGWVVDRMMVFKKVNQIFEYRRQALTHRFGSLHS